MESPPRLRVAVLVNAAAGTVTRQSAEHLKAELLSAFEQAGIAPELNFLPSTEMRAAAEEVLRRVQAGKLDAIMGGGGDGSIRTIAGVLAGTGVPLGVLPLGTLNHFARDLGLPLDLREAVAVVAHGTVRSVDVAAMNGEIFLNNSSIGLYPLLVLERERQRHRKHLPKWLAMLLAVFRVPRHWPLFRLTVRVEGAAEACGTPLVFIGNNEYRLALTAFGRRERLDGAELSIYVARSESWLSFFRLACRLILGLSKPSRDMRIVKTRTADILSRRHHLLVAFDGEVELLRPPFHYEIRPGALRVFVPPPVA
ncbi:MAG TPA: diacylglycerol kinase family protein [Micropepsaceae bacterium]|nr:diacylglycerol kinase family protein [Micropepsaceae bacterium]